LLPGDVRIGLLLEDNLYQGAGVSAGNGGHTICRPFLVGPRTPAATPDR
jgi:hypothetical protein